ncbi:uncharacterized protein DUF904 [Geobacter argillaceus]|jgi:FtsZ-binding cell division protein ZapB|uniref:Uncharacterized protein DUF904 n=1 Tax=Geobacter argillaceus TaxID=345631 RepID=A0A562V6I3_9BACT|nr:uncharacterized protein DUF904 [Geobacter argillaceus]
MEAELLHTLQEKVDALVAAYQLLQRENGQLRQELDRLLAERSGIKEQVSRIIASIEEIQGT